MLKDCSFGLITFIVSRTLAIHTMLLIRGTYSVWYFCSCPMSGKAAMSYTILLVMQFSSFTSYNIFSEFDANKQNWVEWCQNDLSFYRNILRIIFEVFNEYIFNLTYLILLEGEKGAMIRSRSIVFIQG